MNTYPILNTERLRLRFFEINDANVVAKLLDDIEIARSTLNIPHPYTKEMAMDWISKHKERYDEWGIANFAITLKSSDELIGAMGLVIQEEHLRAEIGYWVGKSFWGNGYATEAVKRLIDFGFQEIGLHKIYATCFADNPASGRVLEKVGMSKEGFHHKHILKWGEFRDIVSYGILNKETD